MEKKLKAGIIGYGSMAADYHKPALLETGFELLAVHDINKERLELAEKDGIVAYSKLEDFLNENFDVVVVASPHANHAEHVISSARAKKNVVVEKPMCMSVAEADEMINAAKENRIVFTVFQNRRWDSDYLTIKDVLKKGVLGDVFLIESRITGYLSGGFRAEPEHGGILYDWGSHLVDQILQLFGLPKKICGYCQATGALQKTIDYFHAELHYGNIVARVEGSWLSQKGLPRWYVAGSKGDLIVGWNSFKIRKVDKGYMSHSPVIFVRDDWKEFYRNLYSVLTENAELVVKPEQTKEVIRVLEIIRQRQIS